MTYFHTSFYLKFLLTYMYIMVYPHFLPLWMIFRIFKEIGFNSNSCIETDQFFDRSKSEKNYGEQKNII